MVSFKIIRKIGKILRGGAGAREILLGTLLGVILGMIPGVNLSTFLILIILLLLSANIGFALLGCAIGKLLSILLAPLTFHIGFFIIHSIGLESVFRQLNNLPLTALMGFNSYCQVGAFIPSLLIGTGIGMGFSRFITGIRKKMLKAIEHQKVAKTVQNPFTRFLLWLAFGKQKMDVEKVLEKEMPLLRKSGLILVAITIIITFVLELFLMDHIVKKSITTAISRATGAEVNLESAHLSFTKGELALEDLQVTNPDAPEENIVQVSQLEADIDVSDLLRKQYTIALLKGSEMKLNEPRETPGKIYQKEEQPEEETEEEKTEPTDLKKYLEKAEKWKEYAEKIYDYLKERESGSERTAKGKKPKADKKKEIELAKQIGYLNTTAGNLVINHPTWSILRVEINGVTIDQTLPQQSIEATALSSHPELLNKPTTLTSKELNSEKVCLGLLLTYDNPEAPNELEVNLPNYPIEKLEAGEQIPIIINTAKINIELKGSFNTAFIDLPFTLKMHELESELKKGETLPGLDAARSEEILETIDTLTIAGSIEGSLRKPSVKVDYESLKKKLSQAALKGGKEAVKERAKKELNKLLDSDESKSTEEKAKGLLKKLF